MPFEKEMLQKTLPEEWVTLSSSERVTFGQELKNEMCDTHCLVGLSLTPVARRGRYDDFLFIDNISKSKCFIVHLTWSTETKPEYPWTTPFDDYDDFTQNWRKIYD